MKYRFHHIGYATNQVERELRWFFELGYEIEKSFIDRDLGVQGMFLVGGGPRIELLENVKESKMLDSFITRGIRFYHLAYEIEDLEQEMERWIREKGCLLLVQPTPAVAFDYRKVCFLGLRNGLIVELITGVGGM